MRLSLQIFGVLLFTNITMATECQKPIDNGPTSIRSTNAPWVKAGVDYLKFEPDITNPEHTFGPSIMTRDKVIGDVLYIDGEINAYMLEYFNDGFYGPGKAKHVKTVVLNSFGGDPEAGYQMGKLFRERGITTIVPAGGICSSACTLVFQGGVVRKASHFSTLMVHSVRAGSTTMKTIYQKVLEDQGEEEAKELFYETWYKSAKASTDLMFSRYELLGATPELTEYYFSLPEDPNYFENGNPMKIQDLEMTACEATRFNMVTELF